MGRSGLNQVEGIRVVHVEDECDMGTFDACALDAEENENDTHVREVEAVVRRVVSRSGFAHGSGWWFVETPTFTVAQLPTGVGHRLMRGRHR